MLLLLASLACALQAQQIMDLLTRAPMRSLEPETQVLLWPNSVLDEATEIDEKQEDGQAVGGKPTAPEEFV